MSERVPARFARAIVFTLVAFGAGCARKAEPALTPAPTPTPIQDKQRSDAGPAVDPPRDAASEARHETTPMPATTDAPKLTQADLGKTRDALNEALRTASDPRIRVSSDAMDLLRREGMPSEAAFEGGTRIGVWQVTESTPTRVTLRWTFDLGQGGPNGLHHRRWFEATVSREQGTFHLESITEGHAWPRR